MANEDENGENDSGDGDGPKALRDLNKKLAKERDEMRTELDQLRAGVKRQALSETFNQRGINPKVTKFYDSDDTSPEAVDKWITENADVFGFDVESEASEEQTEAKTAQQRIQKVSAGGEEPGARLIATGDPKVGNAEELLALLTNKKVSTQELIDRGLLDFSKKPM